MSENPEGILQSYKGNPFQITSDQSIAYEQAVFSLSQYSPTSPPNNLYLPALLKTLT